MQKNRNNHIIIVLLYNLLLIASIASCDSGNKIEAGQKSEPLTRCHKIVYLTSCFRYSIDQDTLLIEKTLQFDSLLHLQRLPNKSFITYYNIDDSKLIKRRRILTKAECDSIDVLNNKIIDIALSGVYDIICRVDWMPEQLAIDDRVVYYSYPMYSYVRDGLRPEIPAHNLIKYIAKLAGDDMSKLTKTARLYSLAFSGLVIVDEDKRQ